MNIMHRPRTVECLYSSNCAILPFRWMDVSCCPRRLPNADGDDHFSNVCLCRDTKGDDRAADPESVKYAIGDGDDDASVPGATVDKDAQVNLPTKKAVSDCNSEECPQDQTRCCKTQEIASTVSDIGESLDWREERKQWICAAGVKTPSDLQRKIEDMSRAAALSEGDMKSLFRHIAEVKTFLLQLHDNEYRVKRKRKCDRPSRRRARSRRQCATDCCCAMSEDQDSSTEAGPKKWRGSLLDPEIMSSFGSLIKSSA